MTTIQDKPPLPEAEARRSRVEAIYARLSGEDTSERACTDIPPEECTNLPHNFVLNVLNGAASKLAEQVASAKLVLPWLLGALGAPPVFVGLLLPLRQTGSLLPQLAVAGRIRRYPVRKWFWVVAAMVQVVMLLAMVAAAVLLPPSAAGLVIVIALLVFSVCRGVGSVAFQDVTGKTIPKGRRGKLLAVRGMLGGLLTIGVGLAIRAAFSDTVKTHPALVLLFGGAVLWLIAGLAFAGMKESPGAVAGGRDAYREVRAGLQFVRRESWFRRFLAVRAALLSVELAAPFYVLYIKQLLPGQSKTLGIIVIAAGLAAALSSPFWGRFADLSSRKVLVLSGIMAVLTGAGALAIGFLPPAWRSPYLAAAIFMLLGFAEAGVLLGRKTYLIDRADPERRATFVAFANSSIGLVALAFGALGFVAGLIGLPWLIGILMFLGLAGAALSSMLPEA
ncbi:MAG: MFS transporter [Desulfobacterales bacterium]|nr:MFS transporter [Desulfobacterales bacterium]MDJ0874395.1 MFS transporter [Desulfobacterales bacterium]MDJ0883051.1 MFS transporter [Desulfobacterales bacterium]